MLSTWLLGTSGILSYETGFIACGMRMILLLDTSRVLRVRVEKGDRRHFRGPSLTAGAKERGLKMSSVPFFYAPNWAARSTMSVDTMSNSPGLAWSALPPEPRSFGR